MKSRRYFFKLPRRMPHRIIFAESVQKGRSNDFSLSVTDRGQGTGEQENRESCSSESAPSVRIGRIPQIAEVKGVR